MGRLREYKDLLIDWEMTPEDAVAIYLEWGNNGYRGGYQYAVRENMTMTDPIANMLTRIRNANSVGHKSVQIPASNMKKAIA